MPVVQAGGYICFTLYCVCLPPPPPGKDAAPVAPPSISPTPWMLPPNECYPCPMDAAHPMRVTPPDGHKSCAVIGLCVQTSSLFILHRLKFPAPDHVGGLFSDHDGGRVRVSRDDFRHDTRVGNAQVLDPVDSATNTPKFRIHVKPVSHWAQNANTQ